MVLYTVNYTSEHTHGIGLRVVAAVVTDRDGCTLCFAATALCLLLRKLRIRNEKGVSVGVGKYMCWCGFAFKIVYGCVDVRHCGLVLLLERIRLLKKQDKESIK